MVKLLGVFLITLLLLYGTLTAAPSQQTETFKVGAWGDDASRNNLGVEVRIETHTYDTVQNSFNYFWVGDDLSNGAFIQFGYSLEPGARCLRGTVLGGTFRCEGPSESIPHSDARWEWQYWPDRSKSDFYFGIGPLASAAPNGTVHEYAIRASSSNTWDFSFDGSTVEETAFHVSPSIDPALIVAEGSSGNSSQPLGPTRFDGLSYYHGSQWKMVDSLIAASSCGTSVGCAANEYGAIAVGPGSLIAGFGIPRSLDGTLLWTSHEEGFVVRVHPGVQFSVTSILGTQTYVGEANLTLPKGMFAYISLHDSDVSTPGILGWFGGQDHFQSWVGSVDSRNLTVKVLVDSNKTIRAVWATDATFPVVLFVALTFALALVTLLIMSRRWKEKKRQSTFTRIDKLMRALSEVS